MTNVPGYCAILSQWMTDQTSFFPWFSESEKILKQNGVERITLRCIADSPYYHDFNTLDYYNPGPESNHPVFVNAKTEMGKRVLENPGKWHFTFGDTDEV